MGHCWPIGPRLALTIGKLTCGRMAVATKVIKVPQSTIRMLPARAKIDPVVGYAVVLFSIFFLTSAVVWNGGGKYVLRNDVATRPRVG